MRELFDHRITKAAGSCALAGGLVLSLYVFTTPGQTVENRVRIVSGHALVVDGDTLAIAGERVRLEGIDAPELAQRCPHRWWGTWAAGRRAKRALQQLVSGHSVQCRQRGRDKYGRVLGVCRAGAVELNAEMVRLGMAWAFVRYSQRYVAAEQVAKLNRVGIWQRTCRPAWAYREAKWSSGASGAPRGCAIKGNITKAGRLYHMPWSPWYHKTKIEPHKGERWFCDERQALDAGWRPAASRS